MAEDIVGGLFGVNPAMYQQQQQQQVFNRAVAMQNLDPFQQAAVGVQQAGYNLAGALGGALGGVDPQLQRISALNAISKQIDQSSPESMLRGAKMLADAGFQQEAFALANYARKANSELALAQQRMKEGRAAASTDAVFAKINPSDYTPESVRAFIASSNYGDLVPKAGKADKLVSPVNPSDYTPASIAAFNVSGNYADLVLKPPKADKPERLIGNVNPDSYTPASVAAFSLSNDYNDLVLKPEKVKDNKNIANVNPTDFTPASLAKFSDSGNYADLELKPEKAAADRAPPSVGGQAEIISQTLYGKRFSQLTQAEAAVVDEEVKKRDLESRKASAPSVVANVNAFTPASVTAQQDFIKAATDKRKVLENAPDTLDNIEAAKKLIPTASTFMGKGGEPLLAAASFLNNRLGFNISTKGVTDATVLRTRLFEGILDNLKKLDSQPSQEQQRVLSEALGNLGTDPAALEQILDRIAETVRARVERYNTEVTDAEGRGVKFPYTPQLKLPPRKPKPADGAALIPTGKSATTAIPQKAIDALKAGQGTDAQFDEQFGAGAAKRVRGAK